MIKKILILTILLTSAIWSQSDSTAIQQLEAKGYTVLTPDETEKALIIFMEHGSLLYQVKTADSLLANYREQITTLKNIYNIRTQIPPAKIESKFITWQGFNVGIGTYYVFDSTLTKSTIVNKLVSKGFLFSEAKFVIQDKLIFTGEAGIPFESKMYLRATIGYRIW